MHLNSFQTEKEIGKRRTLCQHTEQLNTPQSEFKILCDPVRNSLLPTLTNCGSR